MIFSSSVVFNLNFARLNLTLVEEILIFQRLKYLPCFNSILCICWDSVVRTFNSVFFPLIFQLSRSVGCSTPLFWYSVLTLALIESSWTSAARNSNFDCAKLNFGWLSTKILKTKCSILNFLTMSPVSQLTVLSHYSNNFCLSV